MTRPSVFLPFPEPTTIATFVGRRKRFLADMLLLDGTQTVAHCPNTGSMRGCLYPGNPALLWDSCNPKRKLRYTWKAAQAPDGLWIGIDTGMPNRLTAEAIRGGLIPPLGHFSEILFEKPMGENSRVDLLLQHGDARCYVEVKNVSLVENGVARFPDAVTSRGLKHLHELSRQVRAGHRAAMVYVVQREDGKRFEAAADIDPAYAEGLKQAMDQGVEVYPLGCTVGPNGVLVRERIAMV